MSNFTFLSSEQYFEDEIDEIKKIGTKAAATDFAILTGAYVGEFYLDENKPSLDTRTCYHWTRTDDGANDVRVVTGNGFKD